MRTEISSLGEFGPSPPGTDGSLLTMYSTDDESDLIRVAICILLLLTELHYLLMSSL